MFNWWFKISIPISSPPITSPLQPNNHTSQNLPTNPLFLSLLPLCPRIKHYLNDTSWKNEEATFPSLVNLENWNLQLLEQVLSYQKSLNNFETVINWAMENTSSKGKQLSISYRTMRYHSVCTLANKIFGKINDHLGS